MNDARFEPAAADLCSRVLRHLADQPRFSRLFVSRTQVQTVAACWHVDPVITVAEIMRILPPGEASRRRVTAHVHALERIGALVPSTQAHDRRTSAYRFTDEYRDWVDRSFAAVVLPALPFVERLVEDIADPATRRRWIDRWVAAQAAGLGLVTRFPKLQHLMGLRAGYILMTEMMIRVYAPGTGPGGRFSRREIAARYGVSRTHLIDLIAWLEKQGWVEAGPDGPEPTAAMLAEARMWHAVQLAIATQMLSGTLTPTPAERKAAGGLVAAA